MKNKLFFTLVICLVSLSSAWAQTLPNYSFENWGIDTNYLDLTQVTPSLLDTSINYDPASWTTSNAISNGKVFHGHSLVTQSSTSYIGASSIQLTSDTLSAYITGVPFVGQVSLDFVCPGFAVCGRFPINLSAFVNLGGTFNPALLPGAGIPVSGRVSSIGGYLKYSPVGGDSAYIVAVLRKGSTIVAQATYTRSTADAGFTFFEAPFVYLNCLEPDTLVYTISSGNPYSISGVVVGTPSGLHIGSTLLADSVFVGDTVPAAGIAIAANDSAHTLVNTAVSIPVTANDVTCGTGAFVLAQSIAPYHGNITISGTDIMYTPDNNYTGTDTFYYSETVNGGLPATARVTVRVYCGPATPVGDSAHTIINTAVQIPVTANDPICGTGGFTIAQDSAPKHGTITIHGDTVIYTPDSNYVGLDTFYYSESIGGGSSGTAMVVVNISFPTGITSIAESKTIVYPNPASSKLYVSTTNPAISELRIYDMLGKAIKTENFQSSAIVDVSTLSNGLYIIQFAGSDGKMISGSRFTVIK